MWLIDADDFNKDITKYFCWKKKMFNPPTEWQEGYLYAIDEFQRNLENRKTVKAITIEWIDRWAKQFWKEINGKTYYMGDGYDSVWDMLEAWEEENGK